MQYRVTVPELHRSVGDLRLISWSKLEGERIEFGDELCVLDVVTKQMPTREAPVRTASRSAGRRRPWSRRASNDPPVDDVERLPAPGIGIRLVASDEGVLRRHLAHAGEKLEIGTMLAIASSTLDEADDADGVDNAPLFRMVSETMVDSVAHDDDDRAPR